jgi:hypothetical protein
MKFPTTANATTGRQLKAHISIPFYILANGLPWEEGTGIKILHHVPRVAFIYATPFIGISQELEWELFWEEVDTDI